MKIGIMTFHWATNYGAVLQAYCLQEYLREQGHEVEIINYKPKEYDTTWFNYLKHPSNWSRLKKFPVKQKKELMLVQFRERHLNQTQLYRSVEELKKVKFGYDLVISGSDQVLNPFFTQFGQNHKPSSAYFLTFLGDCTRKMGYAVSFGCTDYPEDAKHLAYQWIQSFDTIGCRENTGLEILNQLSFRKEQQVVPDPTILYGNRLFRDLGIDISEEKKDYTCVYMLRKEMKLDGNVLYIDEFNNPLTMEGWLSAISHAKMLVTNSYHGMIMAILSHTPFVVVLEALSSSGMNDRFFTILKKLNLEGRIINDISDLQNFEGQNIDWHIVEETLMKFRKVGKDFLIFFS